MRAELRQAGHLAAEPVLKALQLALALGKPLLLDGPSGSGKSHLAASFARARGLQAIHLIAHPDMQREDAAYDWNYGRQLLALRLAARRKPDAANGGVKLNRYEQAHLIAKPLVQALRASAPGKPAMLIVENLEQSNASLESVLQSFLEDHRVDIEGLGSLRSAQAPVVFITTQDARRIADPIRRRCIYQHCPYPSAEHELAILRHAVPDAGSRLSAEVIRFVRGLRISDLAQRPGMDQLIAWTKTLRQLDALSLDPLVIHNTLGLLLKHQHELRPLAGTDASAWLAELQRRAQE